MIERIIEIAEQSAFLNLDNNLLTIRLRDRQTATVPVGEVQCLILANPAVTITGALLAALADCCSGKNPQAGQFASKNPWK